VVKKILEFPILRQTYNYDCGAKAIQSVLVYYGIDVNEGNIMELANTNKWGTSIAGLKKVARYFGLKYKDGKMTIRDLKKSIDNKILVIIALQAWAGKKKINWEKDWEDGHYVVVIGYSNKKIYFADPSAISRTYLSINELRKRWHDVDVKRTKIIKWGMEIHRNKYSNKVHRRMCEDYKKRGEEHYFSEDKTIHMN